LQAHIGHELGRVDRQELVYRFDFDNERLLDQEINHISPCDLYSFVFDRQGDLAVIRNSFELQLPAETGVVSRLQEART